MDTSKNIGEIKEQVELENISRRKYAQKWGKLIKPEFNKFYHQNEINRQLKEQLKFQNLCPFVYTGEGESYFVSRDMYNALCAHCRCGRLRTEAHIIRCLQKEKDKFSKDSENEEENSKISDNKIDKENTKSKIPETSNAVVGFIRDKPKYQQWEQSMKYISPVCTMPGFRITARPYNAIKIG